MVMTTDGRSEIAFFDVETTVPTRSGQGFAILEFGAILVCPRKLVELESFSTLVRPSNLSLISNLSVRCNGITKDAVVSAPKFSDVADKVYDLLHGRIWAGHNILRFDCPRIREAFSQINRPPPEPKGTIDSLALLTQRFGRRAGDMKMATLATYFGLGQQTHRSLDDVRMNLEVLKYCATVLFLESSLPDIFTVNSWVSPNATTRRSNNGESSPEDMKLREDAPSSSTNIENQSSPSLLNPAIVENYSILSLVNPNTREEVPNQRESTVATPTPFDMSPLSDEMEREPFISDDFMEDKSHSESLESSADESNVANSSAVFLAPDKIFIDHISAVFVPFYRGIQRIQILHKNVMLQVYCSNFKVQFGISTKYFDYAGRPRLSFVVQAPPNLCQVLDACDNLAQKLSNDSGSSSEWRRVVTRKATFNSPTVRLHLPTVVDRNVASWATEIYQKELSATHRLDFSRFDVGELVALIIPGILVDAYFSLDPYDFQQNAGIRLVAKRLIIHSN